MKLTAILLVTVFIHVSAATHGQRVTLYEKNAPLRKVFEQIGDQTGFDFLYSTSMLEASGPVTIQVKDASLEDVLRRIFEGQPLVYMIKNRSVVISRKDIIDTRIDITGRILDEKGNFLPGAIVRVIGTNQVASAGTDGKFVLRNVESKATLSISFIGYETRELKAAASLGDIKLAQSFSKLDEVKVVAYGTTTDRLNTGSFSTIKAEDIAKNPVSNIMAALAGHVPGLNITQSSGIPGSNYKILLRGQNSITQNSDPLYVIDGVPFTSNTLTKLREASAAVDQSPLNNINLNDIESISILKDAASTAIYGARGANGVILITTKKAKSGKTTIDVNAYTGIGQNTRRMDLLNTADYLDIRREAFKNTNTTPTAASAPDLMVWDQNKQTDWQKVLLGGKAHYYDLQSSVSGGNANTNFLVGAGYHRETTVFPTDNGNTKASVHFSSTHTSDNGKFRIQLSGSYLQDNLDLPVQDLANSITLPPNAPDLLTADGKIVFTSGITNPLVYKLRPYNSVTNNLVANSSVSYQLLPGLQILTNLAYNNITSTETQLTPRSSFDPASATATSSSRFGNNLIKTWNIEPQLNYYKKFGLHSLNALIGSTLQSSYNRSTRYDASGFSSDAFLGNMQAAKTLTMPAGSFIDAQNKFTSLFARISYNWNEKYLIDITGRRDGSSRFGPGNRFGNFGAVGLGWVFTKEKLIADLLPFVSFGKLRASYGTVGNSPGTDYNYLSQWSVTSNAYDGIVGLYPVNLYNPNFKWELTKKLELGVDLEFLRGRVQVTGDYYRNRSSDQLVSYPLSSTTGFGNILGNLPALVENSGMELTLRSINISSGGLHWTSTFNISVPKNKLVSFPGLDVSAYRYNLVIGKPIYITKLYKYVDVNPQTGLYEFQGVNGPTSSPNSITDQNAIYDPRARYYGGLENSFSYKNFNLSFFFQYSKQTNTIRGGGTVGSGLLNMPDYFVTRWQKPGDVTNVQRAEANGFATLFTGLYASTSDALVRDASFVRLKNVSLSYTLPKTWMEKARINNCRVYLQGQNLLTFTPYKGLDPETGSTSLPPLRVLTAGFQLTF